MWESYKKGTFEVKKSGIEKTKIMGEDRKSEKKGEMGNPETLAKDQSKVGVALVNATSWVERKRNRNVTAHNTDNTALFV